MSRSRKYACAGCARTFLSERARRRHYEWNPGHADGDPCDARTGGEVGGSRTGGDVPGAVWIEFDDRVETFVAVDADDPRIDLQYDPGAGTVTIGRPPARRIDVRPMQARASERVRWSFDGRYLTLTFPKPA